MSADGPPWPVCPTCLRRHAPLKACKQWRRPADGTAIDPTADTVPSPIVGAKLEPRGVVSSDPPQTVSRHSLTLEGVRVVGGIKNVGPDGESIAFVQGPAPTEAERITGQLRRVNAARLNVFDVFDACVEPETVYDFSSETRMDGTGSFVIEVRATPRR